MPGPELQTVIEMLRASPLFEGEDLLAMREAMATTTAALPVPEGVRIESVDAAGVPGEWTLAEGARDDRVVLYLHGGAYAMGAPATHRGLTGALSEACAARVLSLDYRLAPEHRFPAAVEDAVAAYQFLRAQGFAPERIAIAGDSAGGGLTVATLVALRDAAAAAQGGAGALPDLPAAGVCISPWADLALSGESIRTRAAEDPMVTPDLLQRSAEAYLGDADPRAPLASPLFADLAGLPPLLVQVGTAEVLLDDARRLAERARAAGVDVTLEEWDGMIHVWHAFAALLPEGRQAIERIGAFLKQQLG